MHSTSSHAFPIAHTKKLPTPQFSSVNNYNNPSTRNQTNQTERQPNIVTLHKSTEYNFMTKKIKISLVKNIISLLRNTNSSNNSLHN